MKTNICIGTGCKIIEIEAKTFEQFENIAVSKVTETNKAVWKKVEKQKQRLTELDFKTHKTDIVEGETQIYLTDEQLLMLVEQIPTWALEKALGIID